MTDPVAILRTARTVVLHDWPSADVPNALALLGLEVIYQAGPDPEDLVVVRLVDGNPVAAPTATMPDQADIVYSHRPVSEMPHLLAEANRLGATTYWHQSGVDAEGATDPTGVHLDDHQAEVMRALAQEAGIRFVSTPYIVDAARAVGTHRSRA